MLRSERGQAVTETILLTWILLAFVAVAFQVFLANESIYRSMTAVHRELFLQVFDLNLGKGANCAGKAKLCKNRTQEVEWTYTTFPEIRVPTLALFQAFGAPDHLYLRQEASGGTTQNKKTVVLAGTYEDP